LPNGTQALAMEQWRFGRFWKFLDCPKSKCDYKQFQN
jgi:hypothetical protein